MAKAGTGVVWRFLPYLSLLLALSGLLFSVQGWYGANKTRTYWVDLHDKEQARIDAISSGVVKADDQKTAAIDKGIENSKIVMIVSQDNRGLDGTVAAIYENDQLVEIKVESGSGDNEITIRYYLENERDPLVVAHTEVKKDGPVPHQEAYRWYFTGGEYVTFRFSNPEEEKKFSPLDGPEDIENIRSQIARYLELLGMKEPDSIIPRNA